jgi:cytidylate kinase
MGDTSREEMSIEGFVKHQVEKWHDLYAGEGKREKSQIPVITLCMEPGSGGCLVASQVAQRLGFDFFHRNIIHKISESARISEAVIESLEKERLSGVTDFISSLVKEQYIHPDTYLDHVVRVVGTIGMHGHAVVVGRGANFIIPSKDRFAVRVIAPLEKRIEFVAKRFDVTKDAAQRRVLVRENRRRAFIRQSYNADISNPIHYDLILNTGNLTVEAAVASVIGAVMGRIGQTRPVRIA